jgi:hypothetical protein
MQKNTIVALVTSMFLGISIFAQAEKERKNEFTVWGGYSPDSTRLFGVTPDARFGIVALRYARRFNNTKFVNLKYIVDAVPAAFLNFPDFRSSVSVRRSAYGFGVTPLGLQTDFRPGKKYQPFFEASGGFLYFNKPVPNILGTRFNFSIDVGGGLEVRLDKERALSVGYKYYHISNGYRGVINPGFDNNLVYIGYSFFSK